MGQSEGLTDGAELLMRQLHPSWVNNGRVTSLLFKPGRNDEGLLSTDRASKTTPAEAHDAHVGQGLASDGVYGVSVSEAADLDLSSYDDPLPPEKPAHAVIDMTGLSKRATDAKAGGLRDRATTRGRLHP